MSLLRMDRICGAYSTLNLKLTFFFFDSFGIGGLKNFIVQDDRKDIEKILFGTTQMTSTDNKITLLYNVQLCFASN